jgi:Arc/MetJ-type ribon-helix-helix transcriptional regulator
MKLISLNLPETYLEALEVLVAEGRFPNRSEAIRVGIRDLIKTEFLLEKSMKENFSEVIEPSELSQEMEEKVLVH